MSTQSLPIIEIFFLFLVLFLEFFLKWMLVHLCLQDFKRITNESGATWENFLHISQWIIAIFQIFILLFLVFLSSASVYVSLNATSKGYLGEYWNIVMLKQTESKFKTNFLVLNIYSLSQIPTIEIITCKIWEKIILSLSAKILFFFLLFLMQW